MRVPAALFATCWWLWLSACAEQPAPSKRVLATTIEPSCTTACDDDRLSCRARCKQLDCRADCQSMWESCRSQCPDPDLDSGVPESMVQIVGRTRSRFPAPATDAGGADAGFSNGPSGPAPGAGVSSLSGISTGAAGLNGISITATGGASGAAAGPSSFASGAAGVSP